jgi:threonine synthase
VKANETVVIVLTGHMLKDVDYMLDMPVKRVLGPMPANTTTVIDTLERLHATS